MINAVRKTEAMKLRLKGYSYNEIHNKLGIPKSTLSGWFAGVVLPEKAQDRIKKRIHQGTINGLVKRNKMQTHLAQQRAKSIRKVAKNEIKKLSKHDLFIIGITLYWGEGHKKPIYVKGIERTGHAINFTNTDPYMIKMFMRFVREILNIPDKGIRINMRLFSNNNESVAINYWSNVTGLTKQHFQKTTRVISKSSQGKRKYNQLPHGTIQVRINDTKCFHKIMGWIQGIASQGD